MESFLEWLVANYPVALLIGIPAAILIYSIFASIALHQGREVSIWPLKIGERPTQPRPDVIHQSGGRHLVDRISEEQMEEIIGRLQERMRQDGDDHVPSAVTRNPEIQEIPERVILVLGMRREIQRRIRDLGRAAINGWAGSGLADTHTWLRLLQENRIITEDLSEAIEYFLAFTSGSAYDVLDDYIPDELFEHLENWTVEILGRIPLPTDHPHFPQPSPQVD